MAELTTHLSVRQYQRPSGKVVALLVITPSKTDHEHVIPMSADMPFLFQTRHSGNQRGMSSTTVWRAIRRACEELAVTRPEFENVKFAPHDFRRLFATELVNNGLPIPIGAAPLGHLNIRTTRGYVGVFEEDVITHCQQFLAQRRSLRPAEEYREPTAEEWSDSQDHFDKRRVELGSCRRPYGTPCAHEHACIRCPMLSVNPKMLPPPR
ncbi:tyrosine-type recombinase/integrase [Streptomyces sp. ST1015]|uniref:tyrosine-type recombinase/integrase n=1 Tax=Streptomyces sp. ST1015 TaxID=1848900 RepID=UPI001EFEC82D|nr:MULTISPECIES: tyrosine-type recombinase/integrase [unclassified Streptomyces]